MNANHPPDLTQKLETLPDRPGCYIYRAADGKVIYVGKAVVLRNRVRSYFHESARHEPRTRRLAVKPGVTGPTQVNDRSDLPFEARLALEYSERHARRRNLAILLRTLPAVARGKGAY